MSATLHSKFALALTCLLLASWPVHAQDQVAQLRAPAVTGNLKKDIQTDLSGGPTATGGGGALTGNVQKDIISLWKKLQTASALDITYAIAMAKNANASTPTGITTGAGMRLQCLLAIQTLNQQANGDNVKDSSGTVIPRPDPALFTDAETLAEVIDAVQPGGPLWTSCSGAAQLAATNTVAFINALVSGAAGLALLAPK